MSMRCLAGAQEMSSCCHFITIIIRKEECQLQRRSGLPAGGSKKPQQGPGLVGPARGTMGTQTKGLRGGGLIRQQRGNGQSEHSTVACTGEGTGWGRFLGHVGSQATGRWSLPWARQ